MLHDKNLQILIKWEKKDAETSQILLFFLDILSYLEKCEIFDLKKN